MNMGTCEIEGCEDPAYGCVVRTKQPGQWVCERHWALTVPDWDFRRGIQPA